MNLEQLERIRIILRSIYAEIAGDPVGSGTLSTPLDDFKEELLTDMKNLVWMRYLEERDG